MTAMREHAIEMVKRIPEDKMYYIVNILENIEGLVASGSIVEKLESQTAYQELQKYRRKGTTDRNYKEELYAALEEKYEGINQTKIVKALNQKEFSDFEDCLQTECAVAVHADYIVTRNADDFAMCNIPCVTAEELCEKIVDVDESF